MLRGQGKAGTHPVARGEDEALAPPELRGNPREDHPEVADEVHIPDYVMHDFGLRRGSRGDR
jgi:hypothetical protein